MADTAPGGAATGAPAPPETTAAPAEAATGAQAPPAEATGAPGAAPGKAPEGEHRWRLSEHRRNTLLLAVTLTGLALGAALSLAGLHDAGNAAWEATTLVGVVPAAWWVLDALRHRRLGADIVALLALVGTVAVGEYLAGAVIAVMLATGRALESWAGRRARRTLRSLAERAPVSAHEVRGATVVDVPVDQVAPGTLVLVKAGDVVPVDGYVEAERAVLDESALTGEAEPVTREAGEPVRSGVVNAGGAFPLRTVRTAADSTYAGIVRLVANAEAASAPATRLADRYAAFLLGTTLLLAGAVWLAGGGAPRAVAVLVVATPCPLILAVPVALVSGLSRAAQRGVVVKGGGALERLAAVTVLLVDKTGTLTAGTPSVADVVAVGSLGTDEVLRLAASLDQASPHVLAAALVRGAHERRLALAAPSSVDEVPGRGVTGDVESHRVAVGRVDWIGPAVEWARPIRRRADRDGAIVTFVAIDGQPAGAVLLVDPIRPDAARTVRRLRSHGIRRVVMVTGDRIDAAERVGAMIGVDDVLAERSPTEKVEAVQTERAYGPVAMVGDGINDAPALALADVGVALGARGATASSEAADVILSVDRLDRLGEAAVIARRAKRIAAQSAGGGLALCLVAMGVAAAGWLPAVWGALTQEAIDVAAILNSLRALRSGERGTALKEPAAALTRRFDAEHADLRPVLDRLHGAADLVGAGSSPATMAEARQIHQLLAERIVPHELAEDTELYPAVARAVGGVDPTGPMSRAHMEIAHEVRRLGRLLDQLGDDPAPEDVAELRSLLYGLDAILRLHFAQEEESYFSLAAPVEEEPSR